MKSFSELMPLEVLSIEEIAEIKAGDGKLPPACESYACPASTADAACQTRSTCASFAFVIEPPGPINPPPDPQPTT